MKWLQRLVRSDAWQNVVTGLGTALDKAVYHQMYSGSWLAVEELEALYYDDAFARRIVTEPVKAALRPGYTLTAPSELSPEARDRWEREIQTIFDELDLLRVYREARYWGRLYGRGALLLGADDGQPMEEPIDLERVRSFDYAESLTCEEFFDSGTYFDDPTSPDFGEPSVWRIQRLGVVAQDTYDVHASRLILTGGVETSRKKRQENDWRDASVLQAVYPQLRSWSSGLLGVGHMLTDSSQAVLKIRDFSQMLATEDMSIFTSRMRVLEAARSLHIMPIDADLEGFEYVERSFTGVADLLDRVSKALAGAAGMPMTVLFGQSPAGLNATGESDISLWDDQVLADQSETDVPNLTRLVRLAAQVVGAPQPEAWGVEFAALRQLSEKERAEHQKLIADTDAVYISQGVLTEDEVALHRFGGDQYDDSPPMIDGEARRALMELDLARAMAGPEPEPEPESEPEEPELEEKLEEAQ